MTEYSIWPATDGPLTSFDDGVALNVATEFFVTAQAWAIGLRWWRGTTNVNADNLRLYDVDSSSSGSVLAEVLAPSASGIGWQTSAITPVELTPLARYKTAAHMPTQYCATGGYWASGGPGDGGLVNGILTAPDTTGADGGGQGTFRTGTAAFPDGSFNGGCYWVDILVTDVDPSSGIVVPLDLAIETSTAHQIVPVRAVALALATTVDSAQALSIAKAVPLALAVEQNQALAVAASRAVPLDLAVETDSAHAITHARTVKLGLATELNTAFPITVAGTLAVPGAHTATASVNKLSASAMVSGLEAR